jgi:predicted nucleotidyltransferase
MALMKSASHLPDDVRDVRDQIVERYDPERIILFGSTAAGSHREDSDIDLLVLKRTSKPYFDRVIELRRTVTTDRRIDVIVLTPDEFDLAIKENRYFLVKEILPTGQTLYERPRASRRRSRVA